MDFIQDHDIIGLCETKCDDPPDILGFKCFVKTNNNSTYQFGGIHGLCTYVRNGIADMCEELRNTVSESVMYIKYNHPVPTDSLIFAMAYIPPETSVHASPNIIDNLETDLFNIKCNIGLPTILAGDLNARTGNMKEVLAGERYGDGDDWSDADDDSIPLRSSQDPRCNRNGVSIIGLCRSLDLVIANGRFGDDLGIGGVTCLANSGSSVVDYFIVSQSLIRSVDSFAVSPFDPLLSDAHCPLFLSIRRSPDRRTETPARRAPYESRDQPSQGEMLSVRWNSNLTSDYKTAIDEAAIRNLEIKLDKCSRNQTETTINEIFTELEQLWLEPARRLGMVKKVRPHNSNNKKKRMPLKARPWFDEECHQSQRDYYRMKNKLGKRTTAPCILHIKRLAMMHKKLVRRKMKEFHEEFANKLRAVVSTDPKEYWKLLRDAEVNPKTEERPSLIEFAAHFGSINLTGADHSEEDWHQPELETAAAVDTTQLNRPFTETEIIRTATKLKSHKAPGIDNVTNELIKNSTPAIFKLCVKLFNVMIETGAVPVNWCTGMIKPLYKKKGDPKNPDNYRGITLLSCVSKWFTATVHARCYKFLDENRILGEEQAGFRAEYSTSDQCLSLQLFIELRLQKRKRLYCAFIDFRKAFDLVDRTYLWRKLYRSGLTGNIIEVIKNIYRGANSVVNLEGEMSTGFQCNIGVRQGENLSPLLFAIFLNDFNEYIASRSQGIELDRSRSKTQEMNNDLCILLYADDTVVFGDSAKDLQRKLDLVQEYCTQWKIQINTDKTKIVIFSRGKVRSFPQFTINDLSIEIVSDFSYLGVIFNYNGKFKKNMENRQARAKRAICALLTKARNLQLPLDIVLDLYRKAVFPVLSYGCEVWGCENTEQVDVLERNFLRRLLKLSNDTSRAMVYGEFGVEPASDKIKCRLLSFWHKTSTCTRNKISKQTYQLLLGDNVPSRWIDYVRRTLMDLGLYIIWRNPESFSTQKFKQAVKERIREQRKAWWETEMSENPKCAFYQLIKKELGQERYLLLPLRHAISLARFRTRSNNLPMTTAIRNAKNRDFVFPACKWCTENIADEFHFIFTCGHFDQERKKLLPAFAQQNPCLMNCKKLFECEDHQVLANLARLGNIIMTPVD